MPVYKITLTADPLNIKEQEYGTAASIKFKNFTSCMGLVCVTSDTLIGVHLVRVGKAGNDDVHFDSKAAKMVWMTLQGVSDNSIEYVYYIGNQETWRLDCQVPMMELDKGLKGICKGVHEGPAGDGVFSAVLDKPTGKVNIQRT